MVWKKEPVIRSKNLLVKEGIPSPVGEVQGADNCALRRNLQGKGVVEMQLEQWNKTIIVVLDELNSDGLSMMGKQTLSGCAEGFMQERNRCQQSDWFYQELERLLAPLR
jgi:hypothetical protein